MRAIFVNFAHPDTPHISGVRVPTFARILAERGHEVVLVTRPGENEAADQPPLSERLKQHDWREPFLITWSIRTPPLLAKARGGALPVWIRKGLTAWWYLRRGGLYWDWSESEIPTMTELGRMWKPDVVWGTFGILDVIHLSRRIARFFGCPWCLDIKDNMAVYSPSGFHRWFAARRYGDAAAFSVNARFQLQTSMPYFKRSARVIYSGVDESLFAGNVPPSDSFDVVIMGSLYGSARFSGFVAGVTAWLTALPAEARGRIRVIYAGADSELAEPVLSAVRPYCKVDIHPYLPFSELFRLCRGAGVNCYMWLPRTFHHKLVELLWCRRPILVYPGEHEESVEIARATGGELHVCRNSDQVAHDLLELWRTSPRVVVSPESALRAFTWERQADILETMLAEVV